MSSSTDTFRENRSGEVIKIDKTIVYREHRIRWYIYEVSLLSFFGWCFKCLAGIEYIGYFYSDNNNNLSITQVIPRSPKWLRSWMLRKTLKHELGHVNVHINIHTYNNTTDSQIFHDAYDSLTWHGKIQFRYKDDIPVLEEYFDEI